MAIFHRISFRQYTAGIDAKIKEVVKSSSLEQLSSPNFKDLILRSVKVNVPIILKKSLSSDIMRSKRVSNHGRDVSFDVAKYSLGFSGDPVVFQIIPPNDYLSPDGYSVNVKGDKLIFEYEYHGLLLGNPNGIAIVSNAVKQAIEQWESNLRQIENLLDDYFKSFKSRLPAMIEKRKNEIDILSKSRDGLNPFK